MAIALNYHQLSADIPSSRRRKAYVVPPAAVWDGTPVRTAAQDSRRDYPGSVPRHLSCDFEQYGAGLGPRERQVVGSSAPAGIVEDRSDFGSYVLGAVLGVVVFLCFVVGAAFNQDPQVAARGYAQGTAHAIADGTALGAVGEARDGAFA